MVKHVSLYHQISIWLFFSFSLAGQNVMTVGNTSGWISDTIPLSISITNTDTIVAFQTDLTLPSNFQIVPNSARLSQRANGHILSINQISPNVFRVIVFSLNQSAFAGDSGEVFAVDVVLPGQAGGYPVQLANSIVSNPQSFNVLTGTVNATVTVIDNILSVGVDSGDDVGEFKVFQNFPNPANPGTSVIFYSPSPEYYRFRVFSMDGTEVYTISEVCKSGYNHLLWDGKDTRNKILASGIYVYSIELKDRSFINKLLLLR